ncbi:Aste57867_14874 [Aphanomyces stellatus]|uniref:Aste57867_14874 protein n=1 Tax=Aphanomyces stellatus TaxID=120398 RepID=A0A485L1U6_9STRA|nr:hypothetical protein As57867_014818 [Aphanomyces stellatus]VFT91691.1 Aste57867_14874 [Aphanomyces stellatus]
MMLPMARCGAASDITSSKHTSSPFASVDQGDTAASHLPPRELLSRQCSYMIALSVLSFMFIYNIWWVALFTITVAGVGYYAAEMIQDGASLSSSSSTSTSTVFGPCLLLPPRRPQQHHVGGGALNMSVNKIRTKRQLMLTEFFYFASLLLMAFQGGGEAMLLVNMSIDMTYSRTDGWQVACILLGSIFLIALVIATYRAHIASKTFLDELRMYPSHEPLLPQVDPHHGPATTAAGRGPRTIL